MSLIPLGFLGAGAKYDFELISTQVLTGTQNVTFSSIPQTYKHLQLRIAARDAAAVFQTVPVYMRFNGATGSSYTQHQLLGSGASVTASGSSSAQIQMNIGVVPSNSGATSQFGGFVIDILDYTNASKNSVMRALNGLAGAGTQISLSSGAYLSTAAVTQIDLYTSAGFVSTSRFSLYGVRG